MPLTGIVLRLPKGSPLSSEEGDNNLRKIRDFVNALEQLFGVRLNADGTLKDGAVDRTEIIADGIVTEDKLADDAKIPAGVMVPFAGGTAPAGWLLCNGQAVVRVAPYDKLFAAIGTTWVGGDGSTTFAVPDMTRRFPMGAGGAGSPPPGIGNIVGNLGGEEKHLLTGPESGLPKHKHQSWANAMTFFGGGKATSSSGDYVQVGVFDTAETGPVTAVEQHNNLPPAAIVNYIIKF